VVAAADTGEVVITEEEIPTETHTEILTATGGMTGVVMAVAKEELITMTQEPLESTGHQCARNTALLLKICHHASAGRT